MFTLTQALAAISLKPEFSSKDRGDYTVIDYNLKTNTTFIGETLLETHILLNLRGTAFDNETGKIIRLGYNTFFNYGEFPESDEQLNFSEDHLITQKLDGSCIFPIYAKSGTVLGTRAGVTDVSKMADDHLNSVDAGVRSDYMEFIEICCNAGLTPIFEFCSRKNRVVLDYPNDQLILTGIRCMATGEMVSYDVMCLVAQNCNLPVVSRITGVTQETFSDLRTSVADQINDEGVVIRFESGSRKDHMIKLKSSDYVLKHKALDGLRFEKDVLLLVLNGGIDDVYPLLDTYNVDRIQTHAATFMTMFYEKQRLIKKEYSELPVTETQKDFALAISEHPYKQFFFSMRSGKVSFEKMFQEQCKKWCGTQALTKDMKSFLNFTCEY